MKLVLPPWRHGRSLLPQDRPYHVHRHNSTRRLCLGRHFSPPSTTPKLPSLPQPRPQTGLDFRHHGSWPPWEAHWGKPSTWQNLTHKMLGFPSPSQEMETHTTRLFILFVLGLEFKHLFSLLPSPFLDGKPIFSLLSSCFCSVLSNLPNRICKHFSGHGESYVWH